MPSRSRRPELLGSLLLLLSSCGESPLPGDSPPSVLMIVVDTARADKFGCYGHPGRITPHIDSLAAQGVVFEQASANAPWTLPSTASLLTSLHPPEHGAGGYLDLSPLESGGAPRIAFRGLQENQRTLAEVLGENGWRTGAVVNVDFLDKTFGLTQGVQDLDARWYESNSEVRTAGQTTDQALLWLEEKKANPFFLLVHYFDAHAVYDPPEKFRRLHAAAVDRENSNFVFGTRAHMLMLRGGRLELEPTVIERAARLYEAELAYVDEEVGRLLDGLGTLGQSKNTLVILTADHGEEFLDHGGFEHGHSLYQELLHVPLIMRFPGHLEPSSRIEQSVSLVDVAPTICDLLQIPVPDSFMGHSLAAGLAGGTQVQHPILAHGNFWGSPLTSWRSGDWKLILTPSAEGPEQTELYNLREDPLERRNRATDSPAVLTRLRAELADVRALHAAKSSGKEITLDAEARKRLQSLGYLGDGENGQ